jgi:multicomponent Na+:H+ antiporter subunit C
MSGPTLFGLCAAALIGAGLYGFICQPGVLRKILAFNLISSGVFLLFGVIARRGGGVVALAGRGSDGDPVPQALIITGLVVAFAATAIAVALLVRLAETSSRATLEGDEPRAPAVTNAPSLAKDQKPSSERTP